MVRRTPEHIGRIRLNEGEARLLAQLLWDYRTKLMGLRMEAIRTHEDSAEYTHVYNRELGQVRNMYDELRLLSEQKGWDIG